MGISTWRKQILAANIIKKSSCANFLRIKGLMRRNSVNYFFKKGVENCWMVKFFSIHWPIFEKRYIIVVRRDSSAGKSAGFITQRSRVQIPLSLPFLFLFSTSIISSSMRIDIITCQPRLLESPFSHSIVARAKKKGVVEIHCHNLHQMGLGKYGQIDDAPYGGGGGMVLRIEPVAAMIEKLKSERCYDAVIYMAPDGALFDQPMANTLSLKKNLILLCGHYKGIDERIRELFVTEEISVGPFVLSGGELAAAVVVDAVVRLLPGAISDAQSALSDSFQDGRIAPPIYTRHLIFRGHKVPDVLLSGNQGAIATWQEEKSLKRTEKRAPYLLNKEKKK